ncbi:MAG: hypothetical protein ACOVLE_10970 [Pirellula staleyi]
MRNTRFLITYRRACSGSVIQMVFISFLRSEERRWSEARQKARENMPCLGWKSKVDEIDLDTMQKHIWAQWEIPFMLYDEQVRYEANNL